MPADHTHHNPGGSDGGFSTVELVIVAPVMMMFVLVLVGFGLVVQARGSLDGAARDGARVGSLQRDYSTAVSQAQRAVQTDAAGVCSGGNVQTQTGGDFESGGMFTVTVSCDVKSLAWLGLPFTTHVTATSAAPLDTYRRTAR